MESNSSMHFSSMRSSQNRNLAQQESVLTEKSAKKLLKKAEKNRENLDGSFCSDGSQKKISFKNLRDSKKSKAEIKFLNKCENCNNECDEYENVSKL